MVGSRRASLFLFIIALILHIIDLLTGFSSVYFRIFLYYTFALIVWIVLSNKYSGGVLDVKDLGLFLAISSIEIFLPYALVTMPFLSSVNSLQTLIVFFPAWVIYIVFFIGGDPAVDTYIRYSIIAFWIILFLPTFAINFASDINLAQFDLSVNVLDVITKAKDQLIHNIKMIWQNITKIPRDIYINIQKMVQFGMTGYIPSEEEETKEKLGVYIENTESGDIYFYSNENVVIYGLLKSKTKNEAINIELSCYSNENGKKISGEIEPRSEFVVYDEDEEFISCSFDKLLPGKKDVIFNAKFNFKTDSTLETYFMDKEKIRALESQGIDVNQQYQLGHIKPVAIYTSGPVAIGMGGISNQFPIGVYNNKETFFGFKITIENLWNGVIKEVTNLEVSIPDGAEIDSCNVPIEYSGLKDGFNVYKFLVNDKFKNIYGLKSTKYKSNYVTISCALKVKDSKKFLGGAPISQKQFKATASYIYEIEEKVPVEILAAPKSSSEEEEEAVKEDESREMLMAELNKEITDENGERKIRKEIICSQIKQCSDYDSSSYDRLGFSKEAWCDTDPCNLNCYPNFKVDGEATYQECKSCYKLLALVEFNADLQDVCSAYKTREYCEKDPCNLMQKSIKCVWDDNKCQTGVKSEEAKDDCEYSEQEIRELLIETAKKYKVPTEIAIGIAKTEHGGRIKHCDNGEIIIGSSGEIGLMQILPSTAKEECGLSEIEFKDIQKNIECGIKILYNYHERYCGNEEKYRDLVSKYCEGSKYKEKFLSYANDYEGHCWDMAIRAYNGLSCYGGNPNYVEDVKRYGSEES